MENDPFLAAGIDIPEELPYQQDQTCLNLIIGKLLLGVKIRAFDIN